MCSIFKSFCKNGYQPALIRMYRLVITSCTNDFYPAFDLFMNHCIISARRDPELIPVGLREYFSDQQDLALAIYHRFNISTICFRTKVYYDQINARQQAFKPLLSTDKLVEVEKTRSEETLSVRGSYLTYKPVEVEGTSTMQKNAYNGAFDSFRLDEQFMGLTPGVLQTPCLQSPVRRSRKRREDPMRWTWMHTIEESNRTFKSDAFLLEGEDPPEELFATRFTKSVKKFC
ncbi:hypothetical protein D9613_010494 [Agrocybe pediades]|uniref:Uncharacterized protein n=1 Tax=Agrocybe pediades TaxID=84607 RepID=A0A8H4QG34_9AGAR|nr:hypothetical protein D9613_010494 [Agrocybe pediades]